MDNAIKALLRRPIAYQPIVAKAVGSVKLAVLWSQLYYWSDKTSDPEGWIYKKREDIWDETGLTRSGQETARVLGEKIGVIMTEVRGHPPTTHYRIDVEKMIELIEKSAALEKKEARRGAGIGKAKSTEIMKGNHEQIVAVFDPFREVDPNLNYGNKAHRKAAEELIEKLGPEKAANAAKLAASLSGSGEPYAPMITNPWQLLKKIAALAAYVKRRERQGKEGVVFIS
jgi:hypothetical protein